MTREEAIETLLDIQKYYNDNDIDGYVGFDEEDNKALDMAITALKMVEIWDRCHGQIIAPRGTFDEIYNDVEDDEDDI